MLLIFVTIFLGKVNAQNDVRLVTKTSANSFAGDNRVAKEGKFVTIKNASGFESRAFVAGPEDSKVGILFIHDFLESVLPQRKRLSGLEQWDIKLLLSIYIREDLQTQMTRR